MGVNVSGICILEKGRPDVVNVKVPGRKFLKAAVRIEEEKGTEMRVDLRRLQDRRKVPEEVFRADLREGRVRNNGRGWIGNERQIHPVDGRNLAPDERCLLYHPDIPNADRLAGEIVDDQ